MYCATPLLRVALLGLAIRAFFASPPTSPHATQTETPHIPFSSRISPCGSSGLRRGRGSGGLLGGGRACRGGVEVGEGCAVVEVGLAGVEDALGAICDLRVWSDFVPG